MGRRKRQKPPPMEALSATSSNHLPELIYEILLRLPSKSLLKFKCVCKSWKALISDPQFIRSHHYLSTTSFRRTNVFCWHEFRRRYTAIISEDQKAHMAKFYFPREQYEARVFGSCHGLVLLKEYYSKAKFFLWNPSVKKYTKFSFPFDFPRDAKAGLYYDSLNDDYKVVAICDNFYCVYSLRNGCWGKRKVFSRCETRDMSQISVFVVDGCLYWVLRRSRDRAVKELEDGNKQDYEYCGYSMFEILRFDTKEERFSVLPRPEFVGEGYEFSLIELGGRLGLYCFSKSKNMIKIWLKTGDDCDCDDVICWEEWMVISDMPARRFDGYVRPLCYARDNDILLYVEHEGVLMHNVREKRFHKGPQDCFFGRLTTVTYVDSLLLPGVGDKPKRKWLKTERRERHLTAPTSEGSTQKNK